MEYRPVIVFKREEQIFQTQLQAYTPFCIAESFIYCSLVYFLLENTKKLDGHPWAEIVLAHIVETNHIFCFFCCFAPKNDQNLKTFSAQNQVFPRAQCWFQCKKFIQAPGSRENGKNGKKQFPYEKQLFSSSRPKGPFYSPVWPQTQLFVSKTLQNDARE